MPDTPRDRIGPCPCGCGAQAPAGQLYALPDRCRQRAYRRRLKAEAEALGRPANLSLRALHEGDPTRGRNGDAQRPRKRRQARRREGASIYLRDGMLVERVIEVLGHAIHSEGQSDLQPALDAALSARDRLRRRRA